MVVVFSLVADGKDSDYLTVFDLKKDGVTAVSERDQHLPQKDVCGLSRVSLPTAERKLAQTDDAFFNRRVGTLRSVLISLQKELV